jgi:hypothetical protein
MAGWKLRKDKSQAGTPEAAEEEAAPAQEAGANGAAPEDAAPPAAEWMAPAQSWHAPAEDEPTALGQSEPTALGGEPLSQGDGPPEPGGFVFNLGGHSAREPIAAPPPADFEAEDGLRFEDDDEPLTLTDDAEPASYNPLAVEPPPATPEAAAPPAPKPEAAEAAGGAAIFASPAPEAPPAPPVTSAPEPDVFTSTMRLGREELAAVTAPPPAEDIPSVSPFVLDTPPAAPPTEAPGRHLIVRVGRLSATYDLTRETTLIGRPDSEIGHYPDIEVELDDAVSRRHAEVRRRGGDYFLADVGSTNGTQLNGESLPPQEERTLTHGDLIRIGERTEIIFE